MERQSSRKINNRQWFSISMFRSKTTVTVDFFPHIFFVSAVYNFFLHHLWCCFITFCAHAVSLPVYNVLSMCALNYCYSH